MTAGLSLGAGRAAAVPSREELRRQLLALVLAAVLVWYTFVVPAHAGARGYARPAPDDEGLDGEVRGVGGVRAPRGGAQNPRPENPRPENQEPDDELDWPEFIFP
jgi:hypothetical protein